MPPARGASVALLATTTADAPRAAALAARLGLPLMPAGAELGACRDFDVVLTVCGEGLALQQTGRLLRAAPAQRRGKPGRSLPPGQLPGTVSVDFGGAGMRHRRRSGHNELLGKAVGVSARLRLNVLDATAGLGRDSFLLADMGCLLTLCEREPVIAAMLSHGLQAALTGKDDWLLHVARRMNLFAGDARTIAPEQLRSVDVIYLDPMFPPRGKSAAVKKEMALFHILLAGEATQREADELLLWALAQDVARVVVKRPGRAPFLAQQEPSHSVAGKAVRFDVYVRRSLFPAPDRQ